MSWREVLVKRGTATVKISSMSSDDRRETVREWDAARCVHYVERRKAGEFTRP